MYLIFLRCMMLVISVLATISGKLFYLSVGIGSFLWRSAILVINLPCLIASYCIAGTCCCLLCGESLEVLRETAIGILASAFIVAVLIASKQKLSYSVPFPKNLLATLLHHKTEFLLGALGGYFVGVTFHLMHHLWH